MRDWAKPEAILTHESDLDGLVAGLLLQRLATRLYGATPRLEAFHNHNWRQRPMTESVAWVCDLTPDPRVDRPHWLVVDHHQSDWQPRRARFLHDEAKSAGLLCYDLCQAQGLGSPALDRLVHLNNVADLFQVDSPDFLLANDYASLVKTYQFWNVHTLIGGQLEFLIDHPLLEVMAVKRRVENPLGLAWGKRNITRLSAQVAYVETVVGNTNLIVHDLLETQAVPYPVLLTLFRRANGTVIASLRSRNGEALQVATRLQGGGHPNAAGATLPRSVQQIPAAIDYLRKVLDPQPLPPGGQDGLAFLLEGAPATRAG